MSRLLVEDMILKHSARNIEKLRPYLPADYCRRAASALLGLERGSVLIATGFYVAGFAETDGPPGAFFLAKALNALGFQCTVVTDGFCRGFFDGVVAKYVPLTISPADCAALLDRYAPKALIAIERCGVNSRGDYANMRGESIAQYTARLDPLFDEGRRRGIPTFGVGDGGNEIGMGNFRDIIARECHLLPCVTEVDYPIIATVSNWGGYGLCACLQEWSGKAVLPTCDDVQDYLAKIVALGSVDGVTHQHTPTVDGFPFETEKALLASLKE